MIRADRPAKEDEGVRITPAMVHAGYDECDLSAPYGAVPSADWLEKAYRAMRALEGASEQGGSETSLQIPR